MTRTCALAVRQTTPVRHLDSSQDLLGRFGLIPAYDVYVRPFVRPSHSSLAKGKAKEVDLVEMPDGNSNRIPHGLKSFLSDLPGAVDTTLYRDVLLTKGFDR